MKYLWHFVGIYAAFLLQSLLFENLKIFSCSPDIVIAVLVICSVLIDFVPASILGAFVGVLEDSMYGGVFGINLLIYMYFALLVSIAADKRSSNSPLIMSWISFISVAAMEIVLAVMKAVFGISSSIALTCANIFVKGVFAAVFSLCFVLLVQYIKKRRQEKITLQSQAETEGEV